MTCSISEAALMAPTSSTRYRAASTRKPLSFAAGALEVPRRTGLHKGSRSWFANEQDSRDPSTGAPLAFARFQMAADVRAYQLDGLTER